MRVPPRGDAMPRRAFLRAVGSTAIAAGLAPACDAARVVRSLPIVGSHEDGRLDARPHTPTTQRPDPGRHDLVIDGHRVLHYAPAVRKEDTPAPFAVLLHGASGNAEGGFRMWAPYAERAGVVLVAPESNEGGAWDVMVTGFGPDVAMIDSVLAWAFDRFPVDPQRLAIGGFSNGATYTLSLGLTNGDLFTNVVAMSPGGMAPGRFVGRPRVFVSHGTTDRTLPIDRTSRRIVPALESRGYRVRFVEFDGGHTLEPSIARGALRWFLDRPVGLGGSGSGGG